MHLSGVLVRCIIVVALVGIGTGTGRGNGNKGRKTLYIGRAQVGKDSGDVVFSIEMEKILFRLNSVQYTYKVVRLRIHNRSKDVLHLSAQKDRVEMYVQDRVIPGILDPSSLDPTVWDAFAPDLRRILTYPDIVEPKKEENVFVFMSNRDVNDVPRKFVYVINSMQDRHVMIEQISPVSARQSAP